MVVMIPDMSPEMIEKARAAEAAGYPPGPADDLVELTVRLHPELGWEDLVPMLRGYSAFWETGDHTLSPWDTDPDGGELRLVQALREIAERAAELGPDAAMSTESIRRILAERLDRGMPA